MAVSSPHIWDVKMVLTATKDTRARAQIVAKYLQRYNRTDIPIGIGVKTPGNIGNLYRWAADVDLDAYNRSGGTVYLDGLKVAAELLMTSTVPLNVLAIGPHKNLASIIESYPQAVPKVRVVYSMFGAVDKCYGGANISSVGSCCEFNVAQDIVSAQKVAKSPWPMTISPLDTCA